jgi:hypothetical protein
VVVTAWIGVVSAPIRTTMPFFPGAAMSKENEGLFNTFPAPIFSLFSGTKMGKLSSKVNYVRFQKRLSSFFTDEDAHHENRLCTGFDSGFVFPAITILGKNRRLTTGNQSLRADGDS